MALAAALLVALWLATASWITGWRAPLSGLLPPLGLIAISPGGWLEIVTRNLYLELLLATLIVAVVVGGGVAGAPR